jgi:hypothetical protein
LILDLALLVGIWTFLFDNGKELLNTHFDGIFSYLLLCCASIVILDVGLSTRHDVSREGKREDLALSAEQARLQFVLSLPSEPTKQAFYIIFVYFHLF